MMKSNGFIVQLFFISLFFPYYTFGMLVKGARQVTRGVGQAGRGLGQGGTIQRPLSSTALLKPSEIPSVQQVSPGKKIGTSLKPDKSFTLIPEKSAYITIPVQEPSAEVKTTQESVVTQKPSLQEEGANF